MRGLHVPTGDLFPLHGGGTQPATPSTTVFVTDSMADILEVFDERVDEKDGVWLAGEQERVSWVAFGPLALSSAGEVRSSMEKQAGDDIG